MAAPPTTKSAKRWAFRPPRPRGGFRRLKLLGAIRGYRALIDDRLLGKRMTVYIRVTLERQSAAVSQQFEAAVRHCHDIVSCHLMAGQYDYMLVARVAGIDDYGRLHQNELSRLPGVTRLETSFALRDVLEEPQGRGIGNSFQLGVPRAVA